MMHEPRTHRLHIAMILMLGAIVLAGLTAPAWAAWHPLAGGAAGAAPEIVVERIGEGALEVTVDVPGVWLQPVTIDQTEHVRVEVPGGVHHIEPGYPELPLLSHALRIADRGEAQAEILTADWRPIRSAPPVPSRGALSRDQDPRTAPYTFAAVYRQPGVWPAETVALGRPFVMRDRRGVALRIHAVRWNAGSGCLEALAHLRVRVRVTGEGGPNAVTGEPQPAGRSFSPLLKAVFGDAAAPDKDAADALADAGAAADERLLIVTSLSLRYALGDLIAWKQERGYTVEVLDMNELGGQPAGIKAAVQSRYGSEAGLAHLLLVGDAAAVPTNTGLYHGAPSDGMYGLVAGDDLFVDVLVSRLPARNRTELDLMVARTIAYERDPRPNDDWYARAAGIASDEGVPADFQRADLLRGTLLAGDYTDVARIYQSQGGSRESIRTAVNDGLSLVNYLGHGSGTGWVSVPFTSADVHQLTNTTAWPWIIDVACSNGDFARMATECFAEAWLRSEHDGRPAGAVAMIASSSLASWVPPTVMQSTIVDRLVLEGQAELGALFAAGVAQVLVQYEGTQEGRKLMEQYNLFGDGTLQVRSRRPDDLIVSHPASLDTGLPTLELSLPIGARAVLSDGQTILARADQTGAEPVVLTPARDLLEGQTVLLTVTAANSIPYRADLPVTMQVTGTEPTPPVLAADLVNWPNPFNPQTTVGFSLAAAGEVRLGVHDARGRLVRTLVAGHLPAGAHRFAWDGRDAAGREAASGVYLARLTTGQGEQIRKLTLAR